MTTVRGTRNIIIYNAWNIQLLDDIQSERIIILLCTTTEH